MSSLRRVIVVWAGATLSLLILGFVLFASVVTRLPADVVGASFRNDEHTVKAGVNYRFGWGGPPAPQY